MSKTDCETNCETDCMRRSLPRDLDGAEGPRVILCHIRMTRCGRLQAAGVDHHAAVDKDGGAGDVAGVV